MYRQLETPAKFEQFIRRFTPKPFWLVSQEQLYLSWFCLWIFDLSSDSAPLWMEFWTPEGHQLNCNGRPGNFVHMKSPPLGEKTAQLLLQIFSFFSCRDIPPEETRNCIIFRFGWIYIAGISFPLVVSNLSNWWRFNLVRRLKSYWGCVHQLQSKHFKTKCFEQKYGWERKYIKKKKFWEKSRTKNTES